MSQIDNIDWNLIKPEDLKDSDGLVKAFRKYLKKVCKYSTEEARFAADIIENPFAKNVSVEKRLETTMELFGTIYEIYFCTVKDCSPQLFEFYMLVDVATLAKKDDEEWFPYKDKEWFSYFLAKKKFVVC